jgi:hypothetical protein
VTLRHCGPKNRRSWVSEDLRDALLEAHPAPVTLPTVTKPEKTPG